MKKLSVYLLLSGLLWVGCRKDEPEPELEFLTPEEDEFLASQPDATGFNDFTVILPNGLTVAEFLAQTDSLNMASEDRGDPYDNLGPQDARNRLILHFAQLACRLVDRDQFKYPDNDPPLYGLAYSSGSRDHTVRQKPPADNCTEQIYGLDCSGLIYQLFQNAGIDIGLPTWADQQRDPSFLEPRIKSQIPSLDKVKVEELGQIGQDKFETGDIIYWIREGEKAAFHIGMVLRCQDGRLAIYQSNGVPNECEKNRGIKRGPRIMELGSIQTFFHPQKTSYGIVRINAEISGKWDFHFRCSGQSNDFIVHPLDFPTDNKNTFTLERDFEDNDGSPNHAIFGFEYDNTTNVLSCSMTITDGWIPGCERKDRFSVKLERDDTGYIACENEYFQGCWGCIEEVKLVNKE
ncbi:MAG: hypothetical protein DYG98_15950 [Haliscomenobacteraceae bacterium CHB4]|nr:hypothetical protein [Saprospiraceae bacterium]MCE7924540.1 hypothetical protein [Haliscomenobacteraceae bacterium CHB4]